MYETNKVAEAIMRGQFKEAEQLLAAGEKPEGIYVENNKSQLFRSVLQGKAFGLVDRFIESGLIETDVYEYESFDRSFFRNIALDLQEDEVSLSFFRAFLQKIDNRNDEVKDQTLPGYCMDQGAHPAVIACLAEAGCDFSYRNNADQDLIHHVVRKPMLPEERGMAYLEILLREGVSVNGKDITGETPLMMAVKGRKYAYVSWLLQHGADPGEQDKQGKTAWWYAVAEQSDTEMFRLLCGYGTPDFDAVASDGTTLMGGFMCMMRGSNSELELLQLLLQSGASLLQTSPYYQAQKSGMDWLAEKPSGVLQFVLKGHLPDINGQDAAGNTLLHKVCAYNVNYDADAARDLYKKVKMLLDAGADPSLSNDKDETPLMLAQQDNLKIKTVALLMNQK